jgi:hypothetical protein
MGQNYWITGGVRSGKTSALVEFARQWWQIQPSVHSLEIGRSVLLFAMNTDNRSQVTQRVLEATDGTLPLRSATPLSFFESEVILFWPLIVEQLNGATALPLRLRPEAEQWLAVQFWGQMALESLNQIERFSSERWARNLLDVIQLSAFAGVPLEWAVARLQAYWPDAGVPEAQWLQIGEMLLAWRNWCWSQGFLTYGLVSDLYWSALLPLPAYQAQLSARYPLILVDDVESYPAIARQLFEQCHRCGLDGCFTANPEFSVRLGLGADPEYLLGLAQVLDCEIKPLPDSTSGLGASLWPKLLSRLEAQGGDINDSSLRSISTDTRSQLLRQTAEAVITLVKAENVDPSDIAILGPGLDSLARYALIEMIEAQGIPVVSLKEQRPLIGSALVRSLLTLLTFVYPGLGRLIDQDNVAEMLGVLMSDLDPVRAGLLSDFCFKPDSEQPQLLPLEVFPRWDRVGSRGAIAYQNLREWIQSQRQSLKAGTTRMNLSDVISQAIAFFWSKSSFRYDQSAVLRELLETAQHFEEISARQGTHTLETVQVFMKVLQQGTIIANPYPVSFPGLKPAGITLATAYQYRIARLTHPYHFWLDIGSSLWQEGSIIRLWGAFSFLQNSQSLPMDCEMGQAQTAMMFQVKDLTYRAEHSILLCHSELSVSGQEQMGTLSSLIEVL